MKLSCFDIPSFSSLIEEKNPLKQGLKHNSVFSLASKSAIEEKNPLKQGLKQKEAGMIKIIKAIEEKNPLKQGLKHIKNKDTVK